MPPLSRSVLLFDLDGTLINSIPDMRAAVNATLADDGLPAFTDEQVSRMVGRGARVLMQRAYTAAGVPLADDQAVQTVVDRFLVHYDRSPVAMTHVYDGVPETLAQLKQAGYRMAVCTNKPHSATLQIMDLLGLSDHFEVIWGAGQIPQVKPDPAPLLATLDQLGADAGQAVMIGDSQNDTDAARAAGIPTVCVTFGYRHGTLEDLRADSLIDHISELPAALSALS